METKDYKKQFESELREKGITPEKACSWEVAKALMQNYGDRDEDEQAALYDYCKNYPKDNDQPN